MGLDLLPAWRLGLMGCGATTHENLSTVHQRFAPSHIQITGRFHRTSLSRWLNAVSTNYKAMRQTRLCPSAGADAIPAARIGPCALSWQRVVGVFHSLAEDEASCLWFLAPGSCGLTFFPVFE